MKQESKRIIVIGGGPAGLMASGIAAKSGGQVTLLEKKEQAARKLRLTGNGRCNLTNNAKVDEFISHFGRNGKFLIPAFSRYFAPDLIRFFRDLGVEVIVSNDMRVYPKSNSADQIANALLDWAIKHGVKIIDHSRVCKIEIDKNRVRGVQSENKKNFEADIVILATGGTSYPSTGSSGDGYRLAESLGHTIIPIRPASVPLVAAGDFSKKLQGVALSSVMATIKIDGESKSSANGDLLFTHFGISGPVVLSISRYCVDFLREGQNPILSIDILPQHGSNQLDQILLQSIQKHGKKQVGTMLAFLIPQRMSEVILSSDKVDSTKQANQLTTDERRNIRAALKAFDLQIIGYRSFAEAMVTAGGINLKEVNPQTMESRLIRGLYFAGEVLDLDADTGGFNLQAAFSTGWVAGQECVKN